jgi:hypothetical protein
MITARAASKWLCGVLAAPLTLFLGGAPHATAHGALTAQSTPRTYVLIVSGVGGDSMHSERFTRLALEASAALRTRFAVEDTLITVLAERPTQGAGGASERATRAAVSAALSRIAARAQPNERVLFVYIGHGSAQSGRSQLALVGPDVSATELAALLAPIRAQLGVVLAASASGDFVRPLSAPGRVIITATKSGAEQNESFFAEHFVAALGSDASDADKDQRVSLLELFAYTRKEVARVYENSNRLQTEHAVLDDDGDGTGHADASTSAADGQLAAKVAIVRIGAVAVTNDPRATPFIKRREELERAIDSLRTRRDRLSSAEYDKRLEDLVIQLARVNRDMRQTLALPPRKP